MNITKEFIEMIERAGLKPTDFFLVESGFFHAYCKKVNNPTQRADHLVPEKNFIPVSHFEKIDRKPEDHEKFDRSRYVSVYTTQTSRRQPKHAKNVELFLSEAPVGWTLIPYWHEEEQRSQRDVILGRIALSDIRSSMTGVAFELLDAVSLGMVFSDENDAILFAAMLPTAREELKNNHLSEQSLRDRKIPW